MSEVGALSIRITADGGQATRELDTVGKRVQQTGKQLRENANRWAKWGVAAAAAAAAASAALVRSSMKSTRELVAQASAANTTVAELQRYSFAATEVSISQEKLSDILKDVNDRVGDFLTTGAGPMADFFENIGPKVGVTAENFRNLSGPQALQLYVDSLQKANLSQAEMTFYMEAMASDSTRLIPLLKNGGERLEEMANQAEALGIGLSEIDVAKVEAANEAIDRAAAAIGQALADATVELAPIIEAVANEIVAMSQDMEGFGNLTLDVMDGIAKATGFAADSFQGWRMIVQSSRTAFTWVQRDFVAMLANMSRMFDGFVNTFKEGINQLIRTANLAADRIPWMDSLEELDIQSSETTRNLNKMWNDLNVEFSDVMYNMHQLASEELPSAGIERFMARTKAAAEEAARSMQNAQSGSTPTMDSGGTGQSPVSEFSREENEEWLEELRERYMTEAELQIEAHEGELERLQELKQQELLTEQEYEHERERMAMSHAEKMASIQEQERRQRVGIMSGMMSNLSQLMNTGSKKMFAIGKAAAIANALLKGKEAVLSSYKAGADIGGPVVGAAFAATAGAATLAQIQQIRSSSFGGAGGGANTFAGGVPAVRTTDAGNTGPQQPGQTVDINIAGSGNSFSIDQVRTLIQQINEQAGDGVNLAFNG